MAYGESQNHEAPPTVEPEDLSWNTHRDIRDFFGWPQNHELFGTYLDWFYNALNAEQRRLLRTASLPHLSLSADFPRPPTIN